MRYDAKRGVKRSKRRSMTGVLITLIVIGGLLVGATIAVRYFYAENLKPVSANTATQLVTVKPGMSVNEIAALLKEKGLIRSDWAFKWYVRDRAVREVLQAGTYSLRPNQSVAQIVAQLTGGKVATDLVTILPNRRIDQVRQDLKKAGFSEADVDSALDPSQYSDSPVLAFRPGSGSLEGFLYPDSFQKNVETSPRHIIKQSLALMYEQLTPGIRDAFVAQGLTIYQGITLASIVESEVHNPEEMKKVAQVFLRRLREDHPLQSDVTAVYGAVLDNEEPTLTYVSPYNTFLHKGLPPTPISNVTSASLQAVADPAPTNFMYFVAGDDGKTYFAHTLEEHEANIDNHCKKLCR